MAEMMRHQQEMLRQNPVRVVLLIFSANITLEVHPHSLLIQEMMRQMMQDPSVQQIMANPEALRNMMQGNPMIEV